jgi:putative FmdB family regulatory protein
MPIYAYRCERCGHSQDVIQKFSDAPLKTCTACGADAFAKQLTAPSFQLKGSGWYVTDFRDNGKSKGGKAGDTAKAEPAAAGAATAEGASTTTTDSKPSQASGPAPSAAAGTATTTSD